MGKGEEEIQGNFQCTFCAMNDGSVVVTGPDTFKYYRIEEGELQPSLTQINNKNVELTTSYSCHTWMTDGRLIVCTEVGEIIILEDDGEFVAYLPDSPISEDQFKIEAITPMQRGGFLVAGNGRIYIYEKLDDPRAPYKQACEPLDIVLDSKENSIGSNSGQLVKSMCLSQTDDYIYFITESRQILKVDVPLYDGAETKNRFEHVHCNFHSKEITGLDICIRKQLVVTCSKDKSVKIWNYVTKNLELSTVLQEDP